MNNRFLIYLKLVWEDTSPAVLELLSVLALHIVPSSKSQSLHESPGYAAIGFSCKFPQQGNPSCIVLM